MPQHICGSQSPACKDQLSPFAMCVLRMDLGLPGLAFSTSCWPAIVRLSVRSCFALYGDLERIAKCSEH